MSYPVGNCIIPPGDTLLLEQTKPLVSSHIMVWAYNLMPLSGIDLMDQLSRVVTGHTGPRKDFYSATHTSTFKVSGRHILNVWRICRSEVNLTQYTFENVVFHVLHQRLA